MRRLSCLLLLLPAAASAAETRALLNLSVQIPQSAQLAVRTAPAALRNAGGFVQVDTSRSNVQPVSVSIASSRPDVAGVVHQGDASFAPVVELRSSGDDTPECVTVEVVY